jgi:hypothetical protein
MPNIAFAYVYGNNLNNTLNDPSYLTFLFETVTSNYNNGIVTNNKSALQLTNNCKPDWLG